MSSGDAVGPETRYQAASISKTIAALAALSLAIERRLSLDEDVAQHRHGRNNFAGVAAIGAFFELKPDFTLS